MRHLLTHKTPTAPVASSLPNPLKGRKLITFGKVRGAGVSLEQMFYEPYKQAGGKLLEGTLRLILWGQVHRDAVGNARSLNTSLGNTFTEKQLMLAERLFMHTPYLYLKNVTSNDALRTEFLHELECLLQASRFDSTK